jgi:hypothetical protein
MPRNRVIGVTLPPTLARYLTDNYIMQNINVLIIFQGATQLKDLQVDKHTNYTRTESCLMPRNRVIGVTLPPTLARYLTDNYILRNRHICTLIKHNTETPDSPTSLTNSSWNVYKLIDRNNTFKIFLLQSNNKYECPLRSNFIYICIQLQCKILNVLIILG